MKDIIKNLRKEKGLTQFQLAEQLNLDQTAVSKWERGRAVPDVQMLIVLSNFFDVSTDYLLGRSSFYYPDRIKALQLENSPDLIVDGKKLLDIFNSLDPMYRAQILEYAEYIKSRAITQKKKI